MSDNGQLPEQPLLGQTLGGKAAEERPPGSIARRREMMLFLKSLADGVLPFEAARASGRPLSFWRGLARRDATFRRAFEEATTDLGHAMAAESIGIADESGTGKGEVAKARHQTTLRMQLAKAFARDTYGDRVDVKNENVEVRRTEFVSYFGVRELRQPEADEEAVVKVVAAASRPGLPEGEDAPLPDQEAEQGHGCTEPEEP